MMMMVVMGCRCRCRCRPSAAIGYWRATPHTTPLYSPYPHMLLHHIRSYYLHTHICTNTYHSPH